MRKMKMTFDIDKFELRPEFVEKMKKIEQQKNIKVDDFLERFQRRIRNN